MSALEGFVIALQQVQHGQLLTRAGVLGGSTKPWRSGTPSMGVSKEALLLRRPVVLRRPVGCAAARSAVPGVHGSDATSTTACRETISFIIGVTVFYMLALLSPRHHVCTFTSDPRLIHPWEDTRPRKPRDPG